VAAAGHAIDSERLGKGPASQEKLWPRTSARYHLPSRHPVLAPTTAGEATVARIHTATPADVAAAPRE